MMKATTRTIAVILALGLLAGALPAIAQKTDTGSIFDKSGGKKPGAIDTDVNTSLPSPPPSVPGRPVDSSSGTSSGSSVEKSSGTPSGTSGSSDKGSSDKSSTGKKK